MFKIGLFKDLARGLFSAAKEKGVTGLLKEGFKLLKKNPVIFATVFIPWQKLMPKKPQPVLDPAKIYAQQQGSQGGGQPPAQSRGPSGNGQSGLPFRPGDPRLGQAEAHTEDDDIE